MLIENEMISDCQIDMLCNDFQYFIDLIVILIINISQMGQECQSPQKSSSKSPKRNQFRSKLLYSTNNKKGKIKYKKQELPYHDEDQENKPLIPVELIEFSQPIGPPNPQKQNIKTSKQINSPFYEIILEIASPKVKKQLTQRQMIVKCNYGMVNIGNTCYLNSALQSLYQTQYLSEQLRKLDVFRELINKKFTNQYISMCNQLQLQRKAFRPSELKYLIEKKNNRFYGYKQHDSGEVINNILNILDEQTNKVQKAKIKKIQYDYMETDESLYKRYYQKYQEMCFSIIDKVFTGFFKTSYKCSKCDKIKRLFEKFTMVYLPLTKKDKTLQKLEECIKQFSSQQELDWDCFSCKIETPHKKTMQIYKANKTIIFCIKRFNQDNTKIKNLLKIPIQIDLNQYIRQGEQHHSVSERQHLLYAAIIHQGSYNSGHYYAICYDYRAQCWAQYNDQYVRFMPQEQVKSCIQQAYILFYRMKKPFNQEQRQEYIPD